MIDKNLDKKYASIQKGIERQNGINGIYNIAIPSQAETIAKTQTMGNVFGVNVSKMFTRRHKIPYFKRPKLDGKAFS